MRPLKKREIIIEFERVQVIRRKALTHLIFCRGCGADADVVALHEAAELFSTAAENLLLFIRSNDIHFETDSSGQIMICLVSMLTAMKNRSDTGIQSALPVGSDF